MGYKKYKEWGRLNNAEDVDKNKDKCCCNCDCNCCFDCDNHKEKDCCDKKENPKEKCHEDGKLVLVFNTCVGGDVKIEDNFRDILRDNNHNFNDNFKDNFKDAFKEIFKEAKIVKDNPIDLFSNNCVDIMFDGIRESFNEALKNALQESFNDDDSRKACIKVTDNFSGNETANQSTKSSSCAKSEGFFSGAKAINKAGIDDCDSGGFGEGAILDSLEIDVESLEDKE